MKIITFDSLPSTSTYIRQNINTIEDGCYIVAKTQSCGRGRSGNSWLSSKDNLMFSFKIKLDNNQSLITLLVGVCVKNTLNKITKSNNFLIKWPNDIILNNKKVCGILCEHVKKGSQSNIIIGIGINVNQMDFDETIESKATSLKKVYSQDFDNNKILECFDKCFNEEFDKLKNNNELAIQNIINEVRATNYLLNKTFVISNDINNKYKCIGITDEGLLECIDENEQIRTFNSGEISLSSIY